MNLTEFMSATGQVVFVASGSVWGGKKKKQKRAERKKRNLIKQPNRRGIKS